MSFTPPKFKRGAGWFVAIAAVLAACPALAATITWTNTSGGNWSTPANWNPNEVPGTTDAALITAAGTYTITADVNPNVFSLTLGGSPGTKTMLFPATATLTATNAVLQTNGVIVSPTSPLTLIGAFTLAGGGMANLNGWTLWVSSSVTLQMGGVLNLTGTGSLDGPVTNQGTINLTNATWIVYNSGTAGSTAGGIVNSGAMNLYGNGGDTIEMGGGGQDYLVNQGTITQQAATGNGTIDLSLFINTGTVANESGTLTLVFSGDLTGAYNLKNAHPASKFSKMPG